MSVQHAAQINEAYETLKDPLKRGRYLLELHGKAVENQQTTHQDPEFLMQQMELRESLAEVREQADPLETVADIIADVDCIIQQNTGVLEQLLQSEQHCDLDQAKQQVRKMQFLLKMKTEAETLEAILEDE